MYWLILLGIGLILGLIARVLLITAAFKVSWRWGLGVFLPFGPMAFRISYPEEARPAKPFLLSALGCFALFFIFGPGLGSIRPSGSFSQKPPGSISAKGYAIEQPKPAQKSKGFFGLFKSGPTFEERRAANTREFERLVNQDKELKTRKRDLLRSDTEGNARYAHDLEEYQRALAAANAEKAQLALGK